MDGYHGRYAVHDLSTGTGTARALAEGTARAFLGGAGLAVAWLLRHDPARLPPGDPAAPLALASCPLVDTGVTTTSKCAFAARSPQTLLLGESLLSSHFAVALKRSGWDGLVLTGASPTLAVLLLDEEGARPAPAAHLAGLPAAAAEAALRAELGREWQVAAIGPAGEAGVVFATVSHDGRHAGRTGIGAVLGAKRLKAIAVRGQRRAPVHDPRSLRSAADRLRRRSLGPDTAKYRVLGTAANMLTFDRLGVLPARNFREATFAGAAALTGETLAAERPRERAGCAGCTVGCEHRFLPAGDAAAVRAEYESLFALGPLLGLEDADDVLRAVALCDELGMDTLSFGGTVAWAMECAERGLLPAARRDGVDLRFGNAAGVFEAARRTAARAGFLGDLLARGSRGAAAVLGQGSDAWAMHVKGLELPGYEPRALPTLALGLAVGARGACHNRSSGYEADFARRAGEPAADPGPAAVAAEDRAAVLDALIVCKFLRRCFDDFYGETAELLGAATGWDVAPAEVRAAGARIVTAKRLYNQGCGAGRAADTLPPRLLEEPLTGGAAAGSRLTQAELDALLDAYYAARGWSAAGEVPAEAAAALLALA